MIRSLKGEGPLSPVAPSASFSPSRYAPCSLVRKKHPCEPQWFVKKHQSLVGMSVLQQTVSLAAQLRAFSSLLSLPSQAQSVIKAFRRQGIGSADEFNTARFLLSRLESLSALLQVFQIFRGRAELAASRPMARLCALFRCTPQIPQTRQGTHQGRSVCSS